jgi:hypothetical protein
LKWAVSDAIAVQKLERGCGPYRLNDGHRLELQRVPDEEEDRFVRVEAARSTDRRS